MVLLAEQTVKDNRFKEGKQNAAKKAMAVTTD